MYDVQYIKDSRMSSTGKKSHKQASRSTESDKLDAASRHDQSYLAINLTKNGITPDRNWRLRRV